MGEPAGECPGLDDWRIDLGLAKRLSQGFGLLPGKGSKP